MPAISRRGRPRPPPRNNTFRERGKGRPPLEVAFLVLGESGHPGAKRLLLATTRAMRSLLAVAAHDPNGTTAFRTPRHETSGRIRKCRRREIDPGSAIGHDHGAASSRPRQTAIQGRRRACASRRVRGINALVGAFPPVAVVLIKTAPSLQLGAEIIAPLARSLGLGVVAEAAFADRVRRHPASSSLEPSATGRGQGWVVGGRGKGRRL